MMERVITTVCRFCCAGCGMNIYIKENKIYKVEGLPEDPIMIGMLCPKGKAAPEIVYSPERLMHPLRRKGERGEGKWEKITWDEAMDELATRLSKIRDTNGAPSISVFRGQASDWGANWLYCFRFMNALGSPNIMTGSESCYVPRTIAHTLTYGGMVEPNYENTRCLIIWGANTTQTNERAPFGRQMLEAQARGAKLIVVDPIRTELAEKADLWLQVRLGTDCALALGMLNVIVQEQLYDNDFIQDWCIGFEALKEHLRNYPPEEMAKITSISAKMIRQTARVFATTKPSCIFDGNGLDQHINVVQTVRAICILRAITGNIEVKGGDVFPDTLSRNSRDIKLLDYLPPDVRPLGDYKFFFDLGRGVPAPPVFDAMLNGKPYPVKALIVQGGNPVVTLANTPKTEEALRKLEFLVVNDTVMTRTAKLADVVLPASTFLETTALTAYPGMRTNYPLLQQQAIEPVGQSWPDWKFWFQLANKLDLQNEFPWKDVDKAIDYQLEPTGFQARQLKGRIVIIPKRFEKFKEEGFFTRSRKVELYSKTMTEYGFDPLPRHIDPSEYISLYQDLIQKYPLLGTPMPRTAYYIHTQFRHIPSLRKGDREPLIFLHPNDAKKRGIEDSDRVLVRSPQAQCR